MNLTLAFSRKYRWRERCFFVWCLGNSQKLLANKPIFSQCNIFYDYEYFFFNLRSDIFSIIVKEVYQIRNSVVCVAARLIFLFCCALTTGRCSAFQHIFINWKKLEFYGPCFQTMLFLVTMVKYRTKFYNARSNNKNSRTRWVTFVSS